MVSIIDDFLPSSSDRLMSSELPEDLLELANDLVIASQSSSLAQISDLLGQSAPAWYQDHQLGWACLHYAAERREPELLRVLLRGGAIWNAVDRWGRTAGEVCLSLGDQQGWEIIRNEGIRSGARLVLWLSGTVISIEECLVLMS